MKGIDIYNGTGTVDFNAVKKAGYEFVMIKSSEGHTLRDKSLSRNLSEAAKAGLHTGVYHWFWGRSVEETQTEIDFFLNVIRGCKMEMPVALDVEQSDLIALGRDRLTGYIKQWCDGVKAGGYFPVIYANKAWLTSYIDMSRLNEFDIWLAQYNNRITYTGPGNIGMWQYTSSGKVPGVRNGTGNCDLNECYRDYPSIIRAGGFNNYPKQELKADVSWDTKEKTLLVKESYAALCVVKNSDQRATVRVEDPSVCAIERVNPDYTARSGQNGDLYEITGVSVGTTRVIASITGEDSASFPVTVINA